MDPVYGYQAVNVEAQQAERRLAAELDAADDRACASSTRAFGRGTLTLLYPRNRKILAYLREHEERDASSASPTCRARPRRWSSTCRAFRGAVPIELTGGAAFPPIGDLPYLLTLPAYGFFWFLLADEAEAPRWHAPTPEPLPDSSR